MIEIRTILLWFGIAVALLASAIASADTGTLRIVSYNIDSQDQGSDNNITKTTGATAHSLPTVIQAIGNHHIGSNAQPVDVLGMEELLTSTTGGLNRTLSDFTTQLNSIYGAGTYGFDKSAAEQSISNGIIYNTKTVQVVSVRALPTGTNVLLQSNGTYTAPHFVTSFGQQQPPAYGTVLYQIRPVGYGSDADFYMYVVHAPDGGDNSIGDGRYGMAQEARSDAKYNLPAGAHIMYSGDWNLFNGSNENAYRCLTGQITSDGINWSDSSAIWANTKSTQGYDPTSKTSPPTTTSWTNSASDGAARYLYTGDTQAGMYTNSTRYDIQLVSSSMLSSPGLQLKPDTSDPFDALNFPSSQYPYAFETFGNNGSTPRGVVATSASNNSLQDLANASTVLGDIQQFGSGSTSTGSDHYPIVGDYALVGVPLVPMGDYNGNNTVDAADYTLWRDSLGSMTDLRADGNGNGIVDAGDYDVWKAHYGETTAGGNGSASRTAVPEPATAVLALLGAWLACLLHPNAVTGRIY